jgi:hypothetical protein
MNGIHKFSAQVIDYAERLSDVADAAQGKNQQRAGSTTRWLLLPASGAALYALIKSDSFSRQAKGVMDDAKTRAAELPDDLIGLVRQTTERSSTRNGSTQSRTGSTQSATPKRTATRRRKTTRKPTAAKR